LSTTAARTTSGVVCGVVQGEAAHAALKERSGSRLELLYTRVRQHLRAFNS
jgi:hypothetical protein